MLVFLAPYFSLFSLLFWGCLGLGGGLCARSQWHGSVTARGIDSNDGGAGTRQ